MTIENFNLTIRSTYFHHHADGILQKHKNTHDEFKAALCQQVSLKIIQRKKQGRDLLGIKAESVNKEVRRLLSNITNIEFEVDQTDGIYYKSEKIIGFDFALIDKKYNLYNLRNHCFGRNRVHVGERKWDDYLKKHPDYQAIANQYELPCMDLLDKDMRIERESPVVVGEIQFGNWALAYRDFFKVLKANVLTDVDLLIYVVADGFLAEMLSDGIVNFKNSKDIITDFEKVITVPIWLIGIDLLEDKIHKALDCST
jgi:hypothetical protein